MTFLYVFNYNNYNYSMCNTKLYEKLIVKIKLYNINYIKNKLYKIVYLPEVESIIAFLSIL